VPLINPGFKSHFNWDKSLPPGQSVVNGWPVLTYGPTVRIPIDQWGLKVTGAVRRPYILNWQQFSELPKMRLQTDIHCVTRWSRLGMQWEGVGLDELIRLAGGLTDQAHFLIASSYGGYSTNLPLNDVTNGQAMIATHADGSALSSEHGGPARLFVPHLSFWKSAKYVNELAFTSRDIPGFWEVNGYHNHGDPWKEQRYEIDI